MDVCHRLSVAVGLLAGALLVSPPADARGNGCEALPHSALKERTCNPQAECLAAIPKDVKGPALDARRKECNRLPTSGNCYGPDRYDPQAECRTTSRRR